MKDLNRKNFGKPATAAAFVAAAGSFDAPVLRRQNPRSPSGDTWTERKPYYDTYSVAAATLVVGNLTTMFTVPYGGAKTLASTNMEDSKKIADGNPYIIKQFGIMISANTISADFNNILENMTVKLKVGGTVYAQGKTSMFPGGHGAVGTAAFPAAVGTTAMISAMSNGQSHVDNMFRFVNGVEVLPGQSIAVELVSEGAGFTTVAAANGGVGFSLTAIVDGVETRAAQ